MAATSLAAAASLTPGFSRPTSPSQPERRAAIGMRRDGRNVEREIEVRLARWADEALGQHADDRAGQLRDDRLAANDCGIPQEQALPRGVRNHDGDVAVSSPSCSAAQRHETARGVLRHEDVRPCAAATPSVSNRRRLDPGDLGDSRTVLGAEHGVARPSSPNAAMLANDCCRAAISVTAPAVSGPRCRASSRNPP